LPILSSSWSALSRCAARRTPRALVTLGGGSKLIGLRRFFSLACVDWFTFGVQGSVCLVHDEEFRVYSSTALTWATRGGQAVVPGRGHGVPLPSPGGSCRTWTIRRQLPLHDEADIMYILRKIRYLVREKIQSEQTMLWTETAADTGAVSRGGAHSATHPKPSHETAPHSQHFQQSNTIG
jgi:hypothetical protein